ncbi:H-NS histone family protein [Chitinolyticbacter meiyuanensis]|uniref:H-NS histone family protein n=1 Tax=Chitinolyticbacter meiyuanensis TaxID=682798 RepID=UPI001FE8E3B9|nr:H-NS histone family protein [Chitinolyticbacter meiyuanensis]
MRDSHDDKTLQLDVGETPKKRGRPALGDKPMTAAERKAKSRLQAKRTALSIDLDNLKTLSDEQLLYLMRNMVGIASRARLAWAEYGRRHEILVFDPSDAVRAQIQSLKAAESRLQKAIEVTVTKEAPAPGKPNKVTGTKEKKDEAAPPVQERLPMADLIREAKTRGKFATVTNSKPTQKNKAAVTKTPAAKYQHPTEANATWSGRGKKPQWVIDWMASGKSLEALESK